MQAVSSSARAAFTASIFSWVTWPQRKGLRVKYSLDNRFRINHLIGQISSWDSDGSWHSFQSTTKWMGQKNHNKKYHGHPCLGSVKGTLQGGPRFLSQLEYSKLLVEGDKIAAFKTWLEYLFMQACKVYTTSLQRCFFDLNIGLDRVGILLAPGLMIRT